MVSVILITLVGLLFLILILLILAGFFIFFIKGRLFDIHPTVTIVAAPPLLNDQLRTTLITVIVDLPKAINKATTIKGKLYEDDMLGDDHLQDFTLTIPIQATRGSTTFTLTAVNNGNEERLVGNTNDYSSAEDLWQIYSETETSGQVQGATSNTVDLPWTSP